MTTLQSQPRIFVVDDEPIIAHTLAAILRMNGYCTESFTNPRQALETARIAAPDLLISDVVMPQMSGVDLAIELKHLSPDCRILLFSGQASTVNFLDQAKTRGHDFTLLQKPVHPNDLLVAIKASWSTYSDNVATATDMRLPDVPRHV